MTDDDRQPVAAVAADDDATEGEDIEVEPSVLTWARTSIGLDEERAAQDAQEPARVALRHRSPLRHGSTGG